MKICFQNFLLPISFLSKTFLLPSILFFLRMRFFLQKKKKKKKKLQNHFAGTISSPKDSAPPKNAPQNSLPRKFVSKRICLFVSHFALKIFIQKNLLPKFFPPNHLLPNIFAIYITSHNEILLYKILQKFFAGEISSPQETAPPKLAPQNFLARKFASKRICSPFCPILPPKFSFKRICSPNLHSKEFAAHFFLPKFAAKCFCPPYYFPQKMASPILLPKFLCCPNCFVEQ